MTPMHICEMYIKCTLFLYMSNMTVLMENYVSCDIVNNELKRLIYYLCVNAYILQITTDWGSTVE